MIDELFQCQEGVHALKPADPLDPAGTECMCGAMTMIGALAAVNGERKIFLGYLIETTPAEAWDAGRRSEVERVDAIARHRMTLTSREDARGEGAL